MLLDLGSEFEQNVCKLAGLDPLTIDPGSLTINHLNFGGPTTVRASVLVNVDTNQLAGYIQAATLQAAADANQIITLPPTQDLGETK
jgi:hypothetical protein